MKHDNQDSPLEKAVQKLNGHNPDDASNVQQMVRRGLKVTVEKHPKIPLMLRRRGDPPEHPPIFLENTQQFRSSSQTSSSTNDYIEVSRPIVSDSCDPLSEALDAFGQKCSSNYFSEDLKHILKMLPKGEHERLTSNIQNKLSYPFSAVGWLTDLKKVKNNVSYVGTAAIIGKNILITSAHCCFDKNKNQLKNITFFPSQPCQYFNRQQLLQGKEGYKVKDLYVPNQFHKTEYEQDADQQMLYDYAFILLDTEQNLEELYGSFGYSFPCYPPPDLSFLRQDVVVVEEAEKQIGFHPSSEQYLAEVKKNTLHNLQLAGYPKKYGEHLVKYTFSSLLYKHMLIYTAQTQAGCSGGPVFNEDNELKGLHQRDLAKKCLNINQQEKQKEKSAISQGFESEDSSDFNVHSSTGQEPQSDYSNYLMVVKGALRLLRYMYDDVLQNFSKQIPIHAYNLLYKKIKSEHMGQIMKIIAKDQERFAETDYFLRIDLECNKVGDEGCGALVKHQLKQMDALELGWNQVGPAGIHHLSQSVWPHLRYLGLGWNLIGPKGCELLSKIQWDNLQQLDLQKNAIGDEGCLALSKAKWRNLKCLDLGWNDIGNDVCSHIAQAPWNSLVFLYIKSNSKIGVAGLQCFESLPWLIR